MTLPALPACLTTPDGDVAVRRGPGDAWGAPAQRLRDSVYASEQHRRHGTSKGVADAGQQANTTYFVAVCGDELVGAIKVVADSAAGLPCEAAIDLDPLRAGRRFVELGNFAVLPSFRKHGLGVLLMRHAVRYAAHALAATHALADHFIEGPHKPQSAFYRALGFVPAGPPYADTRFEGSPLSQIDMLDLGAALARAAR